MNNTSFNFSMFNTTSDGFELNSLIFIMYCNVGNTFSYLQNTADHSRHCGSNCNRQFLLRVFGGDIPLCVFRVWIDFDAYRRFHDCHCRIHYNSEVGLNIEINYLVGCSV